MPQICVLRISQSIVLNSQEGAWATQTTSYHCCQFRQQVMLQCNSFIIGIFLFLVHIRYATAQDNLDLSFEFQAYPTGLIPGVLLEKKFGSDRSAHLRLGYNWMRHRDLGEHSDERGEGYGFTLGYKKYFKDGHQGWSLGLKSDFWWNSLDWEDRVLLTGTQRSGHTDITVVQPTLELSYLFDNQGFIITPSIAFGYEWNVRTVGESTGQGPILLIGFQIGTRFGK